MNIDRRFHVIAAALIAACLVMSWPVIASQSQFRTATDLVRVYATVKDKDGHLITDLRQEDFELRDRGTRTPLACPA